MTAFDAKAKISEIQNETQQKANTKQRIGEALTEVLETATLIFGNQKTSSFIAEAGKSYPVSGHSTIVTSPPAPDDGDEFEIYDISNSWSANPVDVDFTPLSFQGANYAQFDTAYECVKFRYEGQLGVWRRVR